MFETKCSQLRYCADITLVHAAPDNASVKSQTHAHADCHSSLSHVKKYTNTYKGIKNE